jgi:hypothetical protein
MPALAGSLGGLGEVLYVVLQVEAWAVPGRALS